MDCLVQSVLPETNQTGTSTGIDGRVVKQMTVYEFQEKYPSRWEREEGVKKLSDDEIDEIIESCGTVQGKIYYSQLKKKNQVERDEDAK